MYQVVPGRGPSDSKIGCGETEGMREFGGEMCETKVLIRWRMKVGLRRMAGRR
jgi:hypothetical protein